LVSHKVENGKLVRASRIQVMIDNFYARNEPMILRILDATTRFFIKLRAIPVLWVLSRVLGTVLPTGEVVTTERAVDFIDAISVLDKTEIAVGPCMCQKALKKRNGTYVKDMVILYGAEAYKRAFPPEYKDLNTDEAKELLRKFQEEGLMPTFYTCWRAGSWIYAICNCEGKICFPFRAHQAAGAVMYRGPDAVSLNSDECIGCGTCIDRCHFGANTLVNGTCQVDLTKCYGCGVCIPTCKGQARKMSERAGYRPRYYPVDLVSEAAA